MPASGKSTVGVLLAKSMTYNYIDTDLLIQIEYHRPLQEIIEQDGLEAFMKCEEKALLNVPFSEYCVIATGGSAIFSDTGMKALKSNGICVYLQTSEEELTRRLVNIKTRGIAAKKGETIHDIFLERKPLYEKYADIVIPDCGAGIEEIVGKIKNSVEKFL